MANKFKYAFILMFFAALWSLSGCASVISEAISSKANLSLSFTEIAKKPGAYKGQTVIWGGEIIDSIVQKDGTTLIEVYQRTLGARDAPDLSSESEGRFLIRSDKALDTYTYRRGRKITVGGEILGDEIKRVGEIEYHYPLISGSEIYLWRESYFYDEPYYYDPWWGYPYPGPFWGWPYDGGFRHHHHM